MAVTKIRGGDSAGSRSARWWAAAAGGLLAAGLLIAWLLGWLPLGTDPRVAEILKMQEEARQKFQSSGGPRTVSEATEAFTSMTQIRQKVEALPERLRPQVQRAGGEMFRAAFEARINDYFSAPPAERKAVIDRQIDQEEAMRKAFAAMGMGGRGGPGGGGGPGWGGGGGPGGGGTGGGGTGGGGAGGGPGGGPRGGPGGGGPGGAGGGRGGGPPGTLSQDDGNRWRKGMIDRTSPEQRARWGEYRRAVDQRREERGLPSGWPR
jgi:hypothetical protein